MSDDGKNGVLKKYGIITALIISSGSAGAALRNCIQAGAGVVGLQTVTAAEKQQERNDSFHSELRGAISAAKNVAEEGAADAKAARRAAENTYNALPQKWKR